MDYIKLEFTNVEPVRIADDSVSQSGQTDTLTFVPGSSIRGAIIGELLRGEAVKQHEQVDVNAFLTDCVCFMNAYPVYKEPANKGGATHELLPAIKGFYEDKANVGAGRKEVESVVTDGTVTPGHKRASLGMYGYPDGDCYHFASLERSGDLKINLGKEEGVKRNVFRNQYLCAGYPFVSYIGVSDEKMKENIILLLQSMQNNDRLILGNARSSGLGKCRITNENFKAQPELPYKEYAVDTDAKGCVYMMLLSDMAMLDDTGENIGLNIDTLRERSGLSNLEVEYCSTGVGNVCGYNRKWETKIPSLRVYQKGSLFKLTFPGKVLPLDTLREIEDEGLGVRRNEGFGRVLFLRNYESIHFKQKIAEDLRIQGKVSEENLTAEEILVLKIAARGIYRDALAQAEESYLSNPPAWKGAVRSSQLGMLRSIASRYRFAPEQGATEIAKYIGHQEDKEKNKSYQRDTGSRSKLDGSVGKIMNSEIGREVGLDVTSVCGYDIHELFSKEEFDRMRMDLLIRRIDRVNREGKSDE